MLFGTFGSSFYGSMLILLPGIILAMYAQWKVNNTFKKYSEVRSRSGLTGAAVARQLLQENGISDVGVEEFAGKLTDHYDPKSKTLRLSETVYGSSSLAAIGVAAHETGHAIQDHLAYAPLKIRSSFVPVANLGSSAAFPIFFLGFLFRSGIMLEVGILLFTAVVAFQLITLPVEFNASSRALATLETSGYLDTEELIPARKVLQAAALTYVAAALMGLLQLFRLLLLSGLLGGRRDD